ncbi:hypothetical protein C2845_PM12G10270 [Panicum miliaceum]|uniref:Uncharacterized protein n=1 Tax=Panicum miliaceum TaxID=4540 RepID=A0A3L6QKQ3_PANMI|nr:hypothetical protein C2845_PM12G10270 [Panicum miliaceum]
MAQNNIFPVGNAIARYLTKITLIRGTGQKLAFGSRYREMVSHATIRMQDFPLKILGFRDPAQRRGSRAQRLHMLPAYVPHRSLLAITFAEMQRGNAIVVMIALAKLGRAGKHDLSSLRFIGTGAAPLGKDVMEVVARNFPEAVVAQIIILTLHDFADLQFDRDLRMDCST